MITELIQRFLGRKRSDDGSASNGAVGQTRLRPMDVVSPEEQLATRGRMEAEMDAQRERRTRDGSVKA
ncbi:MAG: hypothetical protein U0531_12220 [Dehalococcoidia bacterium]